MGVTSYDSERGRDTTSGGPGGAAGTSFGKRTLTESLPRRAASPPGAEPGQELRAASHDAEDPFGMHLIGASSKGVDGGAEGDADADAEGHGHVDGRVDGDSGGASDASDASHGGGGSAAVEDAGARDGGGGASSSQGGGAATSQGGAAPASGNASTPTPAGPRPRPSSLRGRRSLRVAPVSGTFLGGRVSRAHPVLMERLQRAEAHLASTVTPPPGQTLREALGIHEAYSVRRQDHSYHSVGLAIDINYSTNPYIGGDVEASRQVNQQALAVIWRATWLTGQGAAVSPSDSDARAARDSTAALYDHFAAADRALELYLTADLAQVAGWIAAGTLARVPAPPPRLPAAMLAQSRLATAAAAQWLAQAREDRRLIRGGGPSNWMRGNYATGSMRSMSGDAGFMDLDRRLVIALRDVGGLSWGASDFGNGGANGDFMHFDCRYDYSAADVAAYHAGGGSG